MTMLSKRFADLVSVRILTILQLRIHENVISHLTVQPDRVKAYTKTHTQCVLLNPSANAAPPGG